MVLCTCYISHCNQSNLGDLSFPEGNMTGQMIIRVGTGASVRV